MNTRRIAVALLLALLISGLCTFVLARRVMRHAAGRPQTQPYVSVKKPVLPGEMLTADNLALIDWPVNLSLQGGFARIDEVTGRAALYAIAPGQPVLAGFLAAPGSGIGLTAKIPEGMRATALKSNEVIGVAGFLYPGSHVDVLVTYKNEISSLPMTQIVMQDAEVLTAGQKIEPDPQGKPETVSVVTLLLSPQDAQRVVLASTQGSVQFVLRNSADHDTVADAPLDLRELSGGKGGPPAPIRSGEAAATRARSYNVETIAGDKRQVASFNNQP
ncbi:MAG: Flp pilus assembly protein CpaB [Candidatus Korobacteraceae bacterium]